MNINEYLSESAGLVNREIENFFPRKLSKKWLSSTLGKPSFELDVDAAQAAIADPIWDFLDRGGKRWRPGLMLLACEAVGGKKRDAQKFCIIPELVHNGTIMVDDVEDNSSLRRGKKSTHLIFGVDVAVNAANAMYYLPLALVFNSKELKDSTKARLYDVYSQEMLQLSMGQAMDIHWHRGNKNVSEKEYLQMCSYKTGSLARMALKFGSIIGTGSAVQQAALGDFGTSVGIAFQIQDDILNLRPSKSWGKALGDDINEGKRTLMVIHALPLLPDNKRKRLSAILAKQDNSKEEILEAIGLIEETGAMEFAADYAARIVKKSWSRLDSLLTDSSAKKLLGEFAQYVIDRKI
ncbi:MAG: polyprenyl synthetase family protein [archaeon]|nr:polyprenyl synthetase family protein [archaeon]